MTRQNLEDALVTKWKSLVGFLTTPREQTMAMLLENQLNALSIESELRKIAINQFRYGETFKPLYLEGEVHKAWLKCCWCGEMLPDGHASDENYCSVECEHHAETAEDEDLQ